MSPSHIASLTTLKALRALTSINNHTAHDIQEWWSNVIFKLPQESRPVVLSELAIILAPNIFDIVTFAKCFKVNKFKQPNEFDSILFEFLLPLHRAFIQSGSWDNALNLELIIYQDFIKQDENHSFYEQAFTELYSPYTTLLSNTNGLVDSAVPSKISSRAPSDGATLFWFQNYSIFAHTQLVLDLAQNLPVKAKLYASALSNFGLEMSLPIFTKANIEILSINDQQSFQERCKQLIKFCKSREISSIVIVTLPLNSGYIKSICDDISLVWWSMKYPLGCMSHFDRLVCNRSIYPKQKIFNGALWQCAPFALKPMRPHLNPQPLSGTKADLKLGVLSREEKFASSNLPEILSRSLADKSSLRLLWTGRVYDSNLASRLHAALSKEAHQQVYFAGWVDPALFLTQIDILVDTPNLGGMVAYWAMSMGKVVISATDSGSVGTLGSRDELHGHFELLTSDEEVRRYFSGNSTQPYYLSKTELIPLCLTLYSDQKDLLKEHGLRFLRFYTNFLADMNRWSEITYLMMKGSYLK
jgi:hypothetical protein